MTHLNSLSWPKVSSADEEALVRLAVPYVRWLNPALVQALANENTTQQAAWDALLLQGGIQPDLYVWPGSACVFPGIRRKVGRYEELGGVGAHSLQLDRSGNHLAHRVWERLGATQAGFKTERAGYELVHLFPLQAAEWRTLFKQQPETAAIISLEWHTRLQAEGLPGLFSNPANMCFLPGTMVRPTDGKSLLRHVLWKQALHLYGASALLPPGVAEPLSQWLHTIPEPTNLTWSTYYHGDESHLHKLLLDRKAHLTPYQVLPSAE